jgi:hypothetical protein
MHVDQPPEDEDEAEVEPETYLARSSRPLEEGEVYEMLHRMNVQWPCLSFDVLRVRRLLDHSVVRCETEQTLTSVCSGAFTPPP